MSLTIVSNAFFERYIDWIITAEITTGLVHVTSSRKKCVSVFVQGHSHDTIGRIERFLNTIAMMDINVNVQNPLMIPWFEKNAGI